MRREYQKITSENEASPREQAKNLDVFTLSDLPTDLLEKVLSFSKNPSTFFFVNKSLRKAALRFIRAQKESFIKLEPGKTYYAVAGRLPLNKTPLTAGFELKLLDHVDHENILFLQAQDIASAKKITGIDENAAVEQIKSFYPGIKVEILNSRKLREHTIYIAKSENGIRYGVLTKTEARAIGNANTGVSIRPLLFFQGEITENSLPLLACVAMGAFENYGPLLDRILAILESRTELFFGRKLELIQCPAEFCRENTDALKSTVPIFLTEKEAQDYARSPFPWMGNPLVIHPCTVKQPVTLARKMIPGSDESALSRQKLWTSEQSFLISYSLRSNLIPQGASYLCELNGTTKAIEDKKFCLMM